jgi:hypothetical protein
MLLGFPKDIRYGIRTLLRNRGFAATALITLALGIGATTAIFSVVEAALLRPLSYRDPGFLHRNVTSQLPWKRGGLAFRPAAPQPVNRS